MILHSQTRIHLALLLIAPLLSGCAGVQIWLDNSGLEKTTRQILQEQLTGSPTMLRAFVDTFDLDKATHPLLDVNLTVTPLDHWVLSTSAVGPVISEKIQFPSAFHRGDETDTAVFYLYRTRPLQGGKVILWVPGMGVSNLAFHFIHRFFQEALDQGYAVAVYVPPFHLERRTPGKENGEGFFSADPLSNIKVILTMVQELRVIHNHFIRQGAVSLGGWGGSMGASALLLFASLQPLRHISVMIPVVDWTTVACDNTRFRQVTTRLKAAGYDSELLHQAYGLLSPVNYAVKVQPDHIQILYAREDQLTPEAVTLAYARKTGITQITGYARSHATILLTPSLYKEYGRFLKSLKE